jgi:hypothetical protein
MSCCNNNSSNQEGMLIVNKVREAAACAEANCASSFTNATNAATSATNAAASAAAAAESAEIAGIYLGPKAVAPTTDNEGGPLQEGMLYFNTTSNGLFVWNGSAWASADFNEFTNFTATGTTTARNLVTRMADVVNVKDFGAIGDGSSHPLSSVYPTLAAAQAVYPFVTSLSQEIDWAAIQAAVNTANLKYNSVFFPAGIYFVNAPVNIYTNSCLFGVTPQAGASRIRLADGISFIGGANALPHPSFTQLVNVTLQNLGFFGTNAAVHKQDTSGSLYFVSWIVNGCWFGNSLEVAFQSRFVTSEITNCRFGQSDWYTKHPNHSHLNLIGTNSPYLTEINALTLSFNRFEQAVLNSVTANFGYAITLLRNTFQANSCPCVFTGVSSIFAANNYWEGNTASSFIEIDTATNQAGRVCDIFLHTNHMAQSANIDCVVNVTSNTPVAYASFVNNYIVASSAAGFYLTKSALGNEQNIKISLSNFIEFNYIGDKANAYINAHANSSINNEDITFNLPQNKSIKLTGTLVPGDAKIGVWANRPDINGLIGGSDFGSIVEGSTSGQLILGIKSNDSSDKVAILSNAGGATSGAFDTIAATIDRSGNTIIGKNIKWSPESSVNPDTNGQILIQFTSNTQLTIKAKGSDGFIRSANLTLS